MDNITKFLLWVVGVAMTMAIISMGVGLWNNARPIAETVNRQQLEQSRAIIDSEFSAFDNQLVSGSQISTAYRKYAAQDPFALYIQTKDGGTTRNFAMQPSETTFTCSNFNYNSGELMSGTIGCSVTEEMVEEYGSQYYIPPQASYRSKVIRDANDRITAIFFKAQ